MYNMEYIFRSSDLNISRALRRGKSMEKSERFYIVGGLK